MPDLSLSKESTVYNYTLMKKITVRLPWVGLYGLLLAAAVCLFLWQYGPHGGKAMLIAFVAMPLIHYIIIRLFIGLSGLLRNQEWSFRLTLPWFGYLPVGYMAFSSYCAVYLQILIIGAAGACLLYVWLPVVYTLTLVFIHFWLMLPHVLLLLRFRKFKSNRGLIRISNKDASYYLQ